jgi:hypothetical protein
MALPSFSGRPRMVEASRASRGGFAKASIAPPPEPVQRIRLEPGVGERAAIEQVPDGALVAERTEQLREQGRRSARAAAVYHRPATCAALPGVAASGEGVEDGFRGVAGEGFVIPEPTDRLNPPCGNGFFEGGGSVGAGRRELIDQFPGGDQAGGGQGGEFLIEALVERRAHD